MSDYFSPAQGNKGKNNTEPYMSLEPKNGKIKAL
jgi:hypothetical protein